MVTAQGPDLDDAIDPRFGRAAWLQIIDTVAGGRVAVGNEMNLNALQGAGIQAAQTVARHGARVLLTGHCGPKAFGVLQAAGVEVYTGLTGTVREALEQLAAGQLRPAEEHDVEAHWH